jgi:hypothetical protein
VDQWEASLSAMSCQVLITAALKLRIKVMKKLKEEIKQKHLSCMNYRYNKE